MGLFNKKPENVKETESEVDVLTLDEQLHNDVYSTEELLLEEANRILNTPSKHDDVKTERLRQLHMMGFKKTEDVKEQYIIDNEKEFQKCLKETITEYQRRYPFNKFISMNAVNAVCKKYGLIMTVVNDYISDIPEKNQDEIINFRVAQEEIRDIDEIYPMSFSMGTQYSDGYHTKMEIQQPGYGKEKVQGVNLLILAPPKKLDMRGKEIVGHILKLKDPIVLQPVRGLIGGGRSTNGYLIVTSWGLEAGDENVVNAINN